MAIDQSAQMAGMAQLLQQLNAGKLALQQDELTPRSKIAQSPYNRPQRSGGLAGWYELNPQARPGLSYAQEQANMRNQAFRSTLPNNGNPTAPVAQPAGAPSPAQPTGSPAAAEAPKKPQGLFGFLGDLFKKTDKFIDENNNGIPDNQEGGSRDPNRVNPQTGMPFGTLPGDEAYNPNWQTDLQPTSTAVGAPADPTGAVTTESVLPASPIPPTIEQLPNGDTWEAPPAELGTPQPSNPGRTELTGLGPVPPPPLAGQPYPEQTIPGSGATFGPLNVVPTIGNLHQLASRAGTNLATNAATRATQSAKVVNDMKAGLEVARRSKTWAADQLAKGNITRDQANKATKSATKAGAKAMGTLNKVKPIAKSTAKAAKTASKVGKMAKFGAGASKLATPLQAGLMAAEAYKLATDEEFANQAVTDFNALDEGNALSLKGGLQGFLNPMSTFHGLRTNTGQAKAAREGAKISQQLLAANMPLHEKSIAYGRQLRALGLPQDEIAQLMLQFRRENR